MKILITGGCGFIGSNLVRHLIQHTSHEVVNLDQLTYAANPQSLAELAHDPRYRFEQGDICDAGTLAAVFQRHRPAAVMHLAAESHVDRSIDGPGRFVQTNVIGTFCLLQAARAHWATLEGEARQRFRFLHVSTDEVFGSLSAGDPAFDESTPYCPHSPYSASKASSDHLARAWADTYGLPVLITNCSNNYGPRQFPEKLVPVVILKALRGEKIPVYGQGENIRDWLYVEDHCRALVTVLEKGMPGETYNIGGNNERQNIELIRDICTIMDELCPAPAMPRHETLIEFVQDRPGHDLRYAINAAKIRRELGWEPKENIHSGFRKTVQWYLDNRPWWQEILDRHFDMQRLGKTNP